MQWYCGETAVIFGNKSPSDMIFALNFLLAASNITAFGNITGQSPISLSLSHRFPKGKYSGARNGSLKGSSPEIKNKTPTQGGRFIFWCEKRDLNPYVIDTRPSNVRVYQFRHSRMNFCGHIISETAKSILSSCAGFVNRFLWEIAVNCKVNVIFDIPRFFRSPAR